MCYFEVRQPHPLDTLAVAVVDGVVVVGGSEAVAASEEDEVLLREARRLLHNNTLTHDALRQRYRKGMFHHKRLRKRRE